MTVADLEPAECQKQMEAMAAELVATRARLEGLRVELSQEMALRADVQNTLALRNAALDAASTHVMLVDARKPNHPIVYVNRALAASHGFQPHELIGRDLNVLLPPQVAESAERHEHLKLLASGQAARNQMEVARRDGTKFWVGFTDTPLRNPQGEITHYVTFGADITERIEADRKKRELQEKLDNETRERQRIENELRLAQKLEAIGRLAAGLAHEINTPIQYVGDSVHFLRSAFDDLSKLFQAHRRVAEACAATDVSLATELKELETTLDYEFLKAEVPRAFDRTLEGADRVAAIVRAMKEFAHPDANEQSPADLNHAIETTLVVARNEYKYAAALSTELGELPSVTCNIGELNQVFLNLIVNAAHAIQDAGKDSETGRIRIVTRASGETVEIVIADNGCGIPPKNLDKIFDPFFTTKEVGRGSGQGLAIARTIVVDKHQGTIDVRSQPGDGTEFVVRLPVQGKRSPNAVST